MSTCSLCTASFEYCTPFFAENVFGGKVAAELDKNVQKSKDAKKY